MAEEWPNPEQKIDYMQLRGLYDKGAALYEEFIDRQDEVEVKLNGPTVEIIKTIGGDDGVKKEWLVLGRERFGTTHSLRVERIVQTEDERGELYVTVVTYSFLATAVNHSGGIIHGSKWLQDKQVQENSGRTEVYDKGGPLDAHMTPAKIQQMEMESPILPRDVREVRDILDSWRA